MAGLLLTRITRYLLAQRPHGLRAAVVELGRLADDDGPVAQDEDALQVGALGHLSLQSSCVRVRERRPVRASFRGEPARSADQAVGRGGNIGWVAAGGKATVAILDHSSAEWVAEIIRETYFFVIRMSIHWMMEQAVKAPHILLASGNPQKLVRNIEHLISKRAVNALNKEIENNVVGLFRLGEDHFMFASAIGRAHWRQIISRTYYGAYNVARSIRLHHSGVYSTDSSDHKKVGDLPDNFPNRNTYTNQLSVLRDDRNLCDYDHAADETELVLTVTDALALVQRFIADGRAHLRATGVPL